MADFAVDDEVELIPKRILIKKGYDPQFLQELEDEEDYRWGTVYIISEIHERYAGNDDCWTIVDTDDDTEFFVGMINLFRHVKYPTIGFIIE